MSDLTFVGAFVMGLMGSVHCVAMCGPIAAVLCSGGPRRGLAPQLGRVTTYTAMGAAAGLLGAAAQRALPFAIVQLSMRVVAALVLVFAGFYAAGFLQRISWAERLTAPLFRRAGAWFASRPRSSFFARWAEGAAWGLLPCGLVLAALALATVSGSPARGALVMLAFGAGTLPALIVVGIFAEGFRRHARHPRIRHAAGLLLASAGALQIALLTRAVLSLTPAPEKQSDQNSAAPVVLEPACGCHDVSPEAKVERP